MGCGKNIHPTYFEAGFENKKIKIINSSLF